jgi:hypothetical protein
MLEPRYKTPEFQATVAAAFAELNGQFRAAAEQIGGVVWPVTVTNQTWPAELTSAWFKIREAECVARKMHYEDITPDTAIVVGDYSPEKLRAAFTRAKTLLQEGKLGAEGHDKRRAKDFGESIEKLDDARRLIKDALKLEC